MSARTRRRMLRLGRDLMLVAIAGLLIAASVHDLGRKVTAIHRRQLDLQTFRRWAAPRVAAGAFSRVRLVARAPSADVVCATRARRPGRICAAVRRDRHGARVVAWALVGPGRRAVRQLRLARARCPRSCALAVTQPDGRSVAP